MVIVKGIDDSYLNKTEMTAEQIVEEIMYGYLDETVNTITILSAGWDAFFGYYAVVKTAKNRHWVVSKGRVEPYGSFAKERYLL